ncbi:hypothetical protein L4F31_07095 [Vibrio paracholerae]|uniref:hypothetical protein n=1 Tax=Vibrio TaxID=662 RepID=UPI0015CF46B7|nr:hypothetical protein [Vibrio paracholerae]MCO7023014.1 hypothetical protein [Vibrio paracholerae]GIA57930.1 Hypothetical protein VCSRO181_0789 [Vibrio cholerae]
MNDDIIETYLPGYTQANEATRHALWDEASADTLYQLNAEIQLRRGMGADKLSMCEWGREEQEIGLYADLLSYDIEFWHQQQRAIDNQYNPDEPEQNPQGLRVMSTTPHDYLSLYRGDWIRLFYQGQFTYGNLYCATHFILEELEEKIEQWLETHYPYQVTMTLEQGSQMHDNRARLSNDNPVHQQRYRDVKLYIQDHHAQFQHQLTSKLNKEPVATYIIERTDDDGHPMVDFICHNDTTLRLVRPLSFVKDMRRYQKNVDALTPYIDELERACLQWIDEHKWS